MTNYDVTPPPERLAGRVQLRSGFSTERGQVPWFMVQLEYWLDDGWSEVLRYDHDQDAAGGHDVTEEGLHRDVYPDGENTTPKRSRRRFRRRTRSTTAKKIYARTSDDLSRG